MSLTELLTDIANAIRNKKKSTDLIPAQNFASEINNLPTGDELIGEYEITNSTTANVVFDNLNIANDEVCYIKVTGHGSIMAMSVNELKGSSDIGHAYQIDVIDGGSTGQSHNSMKTEYGAIACLRHEGTIFVMKTSIGVRIAGFGKGDYVTVSGLDLTDEILTKITLYAEYDDATTKFKSGTKIQLYKQVTV